jgi:hypothetical protein
MMKLTATGKNNEPVSGAVAGTFAIFDAGVSGTDYAPFLNPKANLSKVAIHSGLDYIGVVGTLTNNFTLAAGSYDPSDLVELEIGAHGRSGRPLILVEYSLDNSSWFTANGTTFTLIGLTLRGRSFLIQVDNTKVYAVFNQAGTLSAQTIYFRVHILERSFGDSKPNNGKAYRATPAYVEAAGGIFDTRRRYLQQPAVGQTPQIVHCSGQTIKMAIGDETNEIDIGMASHSNNFNVPLGDIWSTSWPPYIANPTKTELVLNGPSSLGSRAIFESGRIRLSDSSGVDVFDSNRKMISLVEDVKTTVVVPSRSAVTSDPIHDVVHYSTPVPSGADIIFGYMEIKSAGMRIKINKPLEFSGAIIVVGFLFTMSGALYVRGLSCIYPRIHGGNLEIVEHYFNRTLPGSSNTALPTYTVDVHMFVAAATGGF